MAMTPFSFRESKSGLWILSADAIRPVELLHFLALARPALRTSESKEEKGVIAMGRDQDHVIDRGSHGVRLLPLLANVSAEPGQGVANFLLRTLHLFHLCTCKNIEGV